MNNLLAIFISIVTAFSISSTAVPVYAESNVVQSVTLQENQIVDKDYFAGGDTVTILGTVNGDAYVAGGTVIVDGTINGDLLVAGGMVDIRGKVRDDVRAAGGQITMSGEVGRNITAVGGSVTITDAAVIAGSLTAGTGSLSIFAPIGKEANIGAGQVTIDNTINGDVQAGVGTITLTPKAKIVGGLTYWSEENALINDSSQITGKTTHNLPPQPKEEAPESSKAPYVFAGFNAAFTILSFLGALVIGLLMVKGMPVYVQRTATVVLEKPFQSLGIGFLSMVLVPFITLFLLVTVIGIPLDLIFISIFFISMYLAKLFVGIAIGQKILVILKKKAALGWTLLLGLSVYYVLSLIPLLGFVFSMIAGFMGLGAIVLERKSTYTDLRKKGFI